MAYNNARADLTPTQTELLNQILGHMTMTYTKSEIQEHELPSIPVSVSGEQHDFHFKNASYPYRILSCASGFVVIAYKRPDAGRVTAEMTFDDENTFWMSPEALPSSREYFVRVSR